MGAKIASRLLKLQIAAPARGRRRWLGFQQTPSRARPTKSRPRPFPLRPKFPQPLDSIRFAEDAVYKKGDFWLEQTFELGGEAKYDGKPILKLFAGFDDKTQQSALTVTLRGWEAVLESDEGKDGAKHELARAKLPQFPPGEYDLGVLWRRGELGVWFGATEILTWHPADPATEAAALKLDSAVQVLADGVKLGARRALAFDAIRFDDNFMRSKAYVDWRGVIGLWVLTAMALAERSANPFSLRASFTGKKPFDDEIYGGTKRTRSEEYGIGVQVYYAEGTPHIVRLTGGSPAAHAGLAEDDIFIEINGQPVAGNNSAMRALYSGGGELHLKMYRPGENAFREYNIPREGFRWGVSVEAESIPPVAAPSVRGGDEFSLVLSGEAGWSDYEAEVAVKPLGGGGFGLVVAALSEQDYVLFRWRGPHPRGDVGNGKTNVMELVRVKDGKETVLAEKIAHYRPYEFYRMGVDWSGDKIRCMIDKNEMFSATIPDVKRGRVGLYALKGEPVFFDDVHVAGDRAITAAWHLAERSINSIFALEDDMEVWANPALEWERDIKTGWSIHNQRFPGEQAVSIAKPRFKDLQVALYSGDDPELPACPRLTIRDGFAEISGEGFDKQRVEVGPGPFQRVGMDASMAGVHAVIDGKKLEAAWSGGKPFFGGAGVRKAGEHVAIKGLKNLGEPSAVRVTSTGTMEYSFDNAPSDWKVLSGRWGLLNKWICDPRWSWFGGRTKTVASIWNKHIFSGDVSVDTHVALLMVRDDEPYERPGDHNITICGDGVNPDSGYTLIFGGDINSWTRLYRKGVLVAEATKEQFRVHSDRIRHPDKPDLHQRWFHLKLEKIGNTVAFYRDGALAFKYVDPEPLTEGRVGFWTMDNSFLLSRVRIAHGGARPAPFEDGKAALYDFGNAVNLYDGEVPTSVAIETLPKEVSDAMNTPPNAFRAVDGVAPVAENAATPATNADAPPFSTAYHLTNGIGGGPFALQFRSMINIEHDGVVRFAYRIDPGAMVDFYLVGVRDGDFNPRHQLCFRWRLSGPKEDNSGALSDEFAPLVGDVPGAVADGKWHVAQFSLQPTWREFWKRRGNARPMQYTLRPMFGNLSNTGYLLAGMNGNHAGAAYSVTEIKTMSVEAADNQAPKVLRAVWPFDAEGDGHSVRIDFDEPGGTGIIPELLRATLNDIPIPGESLQFNGPSSFNFATQQLTIDLAKLKGKNDALPFELKDGEKYALKIAPNFTDRAGNANTEGFVSEWTYRASDALRAKKPVNAPVISFRTTDASEVRPGDHALGLADVQSLQQMVRVQASPDAPPWAPAGEKSSIEVVSTGELSAMGFSMQNVRYDLQRWPYLELEYKVPLDTPFNLHLLDENGNYHALLLVDVEDGRDMKSQDLLSRFGPPADFIPDNTWRRSTVPLLKLFSEANPGANGLKVSGFSFHDHGWRGGRRGLHYWIHRVQPVPAGRPQDIAVSWANADIAGIVDEETSVDDSPTGDPSGKHELLAGKTLAASLLASGKKLKDGWNYVHVRSKSGAGVWSETAHRKFFLDTTPPRVVKTEPADGGTLASQTVRIYVDEEHGYDWNNATLRVNGETITHAVSFDVTKNLLTFDAAGAGIKLAPGSKVKMELSGMADKLGNVQRAPYTFSFTCAPAAGAPGPEIASLSLLSSTQHSGSPRQYEMELSFGLNFEQHFGHVHAMRDCKMEWLNDPLLAAEGNRALRFTGLQDDGDPQIMLHKNPWYIDRLPLLHFDYKADPGFKVDLHIEAFGTWYSVRFLGTGHAPNGGKAIGAFPGIVADGTWRHASVDLRALLDAAKVRLPDRIVNKIVFSANGEDGNVRGTTMLIDNFDMVPPNCGYWAGSRSILKWTPKKTPAEISGYSFVLDQDPTTIPPESINQPGDAVSVPTHSGEWFAHVRACDQAGNWGPDKTIRLEFGKQSPRQPFRNFDDDN